MAEIIEEKYKDYLFKFQYKKELQRAKKDHDKYTFVEIRDGKINFSNSNEFISQTSIKDYWNEWIGVKPFPSTVKVTVIPEMTVLHFDGKVGILQYFKYIKSRLTCVEVERITEEELVHALIFTWPYDRVEITVDLSTM